MTDVIVLTAEIAFELYKEGHITKTDLTRVIQKCINARAIENGYVEKFGMPFPDTKFDDSDLVLEIVDVEETK